MLKTGGKDSGFGEAAQQQASAALASAADDLMARHAQMQAMERKKAAAAARTRGPGERVATAAKASKDEGEADDDDDDDDKEDEEVWLDAMREKRLAAIQKACAQRQSRLRTGDGEYKHIVECDFLKEVTGAERVVCHFFHRDFERCKIMDMHLARLAAEHDDTKFIKIDAEKAPFFVQKLAIRVLPTLVIFNDGVAVDRIIGFNDVGNKDDFATGVLEKRLIRAGAIFDEEAERRSRKAKPVKTLL
ncbi:Thioredoxin domain-containing protein [Plasmodiophora brassicae]|uniref:Thioredoxin domain-containing protein n=1 Tax=Plasmodiophora brassicae TaxID=37360 RepID=A0A0G4IYP8_PLABS|nr:hypothetical protein PBRA_001542 [Plasmodiophora brassicae]SPQ94012.1 unnamed protein product [Plasmodiophora brassicae]